MFFVMFESFTGHTELTLHGAWPAGPGGSVCRGVLILRKSRPGCCGGAARFITRVARAHARSAVLARTLFGLRVGSTTLLGPHPLLGGGGVVALVLCRAFSARGTRARSGRPSKSRGPGSGSGASQLFGACVACGYATLRKSDGEGVPRLWRETPSHVRARERRRVS